MKKPMTKEERTQVETDLATLRRAVAQCEKELAEDDECMKAASAESAGAAVKAIADGGTGDKREQARRGILAIREAGGTRISDVVYSDRKK
jgi:prephenate dehydratase